MTPIATIRTYDELYAGATHAGGCALGEPLRYRRKAHF